MFLIGLDVSSFMVNVCISLGGLDIMDLRIKMSILVSVAWNVFALFLN